MTVSNVQLQYMNARVAHAKDARMTANVKVAIRVWDATVHVMDFLVAIMMAKVIYTLSVHITVKHNPLSSEKHHLLLVEYIDPCLHTYTPNTFD